MQPLLRLHGLFRQTLTDLIQSFSVFFVAFLTQLIAEIFDQCQAIAFFAPDYVLTQINVFFDF